MQAEIPKNNIQKDYLKNLRKKNGFSQDFVASKLEITRQTYSHYETGRINPPVKSLWKLAKLYGVPVEDLIEPAYGKEAASQGNGGQYADSYRIVDEQERQLLSYYEGLNEHDRQIMFSLLKLTYENCRK